LTAPTSGDEASCPLFIPTICRHGL